MDITVNGLMNLIQTEETLFKCALANTVALMPLKSFKGVLVCDALECLIVYILGGFRVIVAMRKEYKQVNPLSQTMRQSEH